jgi:membrane protein implicated in regulation of membrane protease activity
MTLTLRSDRLRLLLVVAEHTPAGFTSSSSASAPSWSACCRCSAWPTGGATPAVLVLSLSALALFRGGCCMVPERPQRPLIDTLVGDRHGSEDLPSAVGKVELRGTTWSARNDSGADRHRHALPVARRGLLLQ